MFSILTRFRCSPAGLLVLSLLLVGCPVDDDDAPDDDDATADDDDVVDDDDGADDDDISDDDDSADTTPPSLTLVSPLDGSTASGVVTIEVVATDDVGVALVVITVGGEPVAELTEDPWTATWDSSTVVNGNYALRVTAADEAGNESAVSATLLVDNGGLPPGAVGLINPVDGATLCGTVTVEAVTTEPEASLTFSLDGIDLAVDDAAPFTWDWNTESTSNGPHSLSATATTDAGSAQATISLEVLNEGGDCDNLPTVSLVSPAAGTYTNGVIDLQADASDDEGVVGVAFFVDNGMLFDDTSIPYATTWDSDLFDEGPHLVKARATDTGGQTSETQITVSIDRTPPGIEFTAPPSGPAIQGSVLVELTVTEAIGVAEVTLEIDGGGAVVVAGPPYEYLWDTTAEDFGEHVLAATVVDRVGFDGESTLELDVDNPPEITITSPTSGDTVAEPTIIEATTADDDEVDYVEYHLDGVLQTTDPAPPWQFVLDPCSTAPGSHTLELTATDSGGNTATASIPVTTATADDDGDGFDACTDCNDDSAAAFPGGTEVCDDGVDGDCDGTTNNCDLLGEFFLDVADARLDGAESNDGAGSAVVALGDMDGDSFGDIAVLADGSGGDVIYVVSGPVSGPIDLATTAVATIETTDSGLLTYASLAGGQDVSGDGIPDLLVGAPLSEPTASDQGSVYVFNGPVTGTLTLDDADARLDGETNGDKAGRFLAVADYDGDGTGDILVGAEDAGPIPFPPGRAYVVLGPVGGISDLATADVIFEGQNSGDDAGWAVAFAGDVNGDGSEDVLVGARQYDYGGDNSVGATYLIYGPVYGLVSLDDADYRFRGEDYLDRSGSSLAGLGDTNDDGYDDFLVGAPGNDDAANDAGAAYLILGPVTGSYSKTLASSADAKFLGVGVDSQAGQGVASAGDFNGDGVADALIGAEQYSPDCGTGNGAVYLYYGPLPTGTTSLGDADVAWIGEFGGQIPERDLTCQGDGDPDWAWYARSAGDLDSDGHGDLLIGAPGYDVLVGDEGAAYVVLGTGL